MDFNAIINAAIRSAVEAQKDELIKKTLDEDHNFIMYKLEKIFDEAQKQFKKSLKNVKNNKKILDIVTNMKNQIEEAVTGNKVEEPVEEEDDDENRGPGWYKDQDGNWDWDRDAAESASYAEDMYAGYGEEDDTSEAVEETDDELIEYQEIPVDKQKRITISFDTLYEARMWQEDVFKILKSKEDDNVFYIVNMNFSYDINKFEFIKNIEYSGKKAIRIGIGKLLDVKYGDIIGVDVYREQIMIFNTNSNVEDFDKQEEVVKQEEQITEDEPKVNNSPIRNIVNGIKSKFCKK